MIHKRSKDKYYTLRIRSIPECNYKSTYSDLVTIRWDEGNPLPLPHDRAEFYDVGINDYCTAGCPFCYTNATPQGDNYSDIISLWNRFISSLPTEHDRPYQIAIGSTGEPTEHPLLPEFLAHVYKTGVVPNYTTNGVILSQHNKTKDQGKQAYINRLLQATRDYVGGVAVSYSHKHLIKQAERAVEVLKDEGDTHINRHHIISDIASVDALKSVIDRYGEDIKYHVLLPLMPQGRSTQSMDPEAFSHIEKMILDNGYTNVAFGANFYDFLLDSKINFWHHPKELYSRNMLLKDNKVIITQNSFNLTPLMTI